jgi:hypothetical protein
MLKWRQMCIYAVGWAKENSLLTDFWLLRRGGILQPRLRLAV